MYKPFQTQCIINVLLVTVWTFVCLFVSPMSGYAAPRQQQPDKGEPMLNEFALRAMNFFDKKNYDSAALYFRKAIARDTSNVYNKYELALALVMKKEFDPARDILESIIAHPSSKDNFFQLLGNIYAEKDDTVKARECYQAGLKRFHSSGKLHMELGLLNLQHRKLDEAIDEFEEGIQVEPSFIHNYFWAARVYSGTGEKIWTVLYGELVLNADESPIKQNVLSTVIYNAHREVFERFESGGAMDYSKAVRGASDATQKDMVSFEDTFDELMTQGARQLKFFRDFELPIGSIDTLWTEFVARWAVAKDSKKFKNCIIERHRELITAKLHRAYIFHIFRFAKPLEFEAYTKENRKEYDRYLAWRTKHPLLVDSKNAFSRFTY